MAQYTDPRIIKPVTDRLVGEALAAINAGGVELPIEIEDVNGLQDALDALAIPTPPASGTFVLTSTDGVLSWEVQA